MDREDEGNRAVAFYDRRTRRQGNRSERHALHSPRRPQCEGLCEAQGERVSTSLAVGTSRATGEGKEGQQDEIHLPGLGAKRIVKGQRWLLLTRWINLSSGKRQELNSLFAFNRKLFKACLLKESLDRLWNYRYEGAMLNYLQRWMDHPG